MTPKEKYQDIDASASVLPEKAIINLKQLKPILFDKKYQTEEYSDTRKKAEEKMNAMYDKISKDYPDAIKSKVAKQPEPKTPQAMAQKAAKQTIKQPTVKNPKATAGANNRGNVTKLAKEIRKDGETWHAAMKRAGEMINKEKGKAVKKANVQYEKLKAFLAKNPSIEKTMVTYGKKPNQGTRPLDVKRDAARVAKPKGKRVSSEGKTYYEYRANRTDSSRKRYPYLELGGKLFGAGHFAKGGKTEDKIKLEIIDPNNDFRYDADGKKGKVLFTKYFDSKKDFSIYAKAFDKYGYAELQGMDARGKVLISYENPNLYESFEETFSDFKKDKNLSDFNNRYSKCVKWAVKFGMKKDNKITILFQKDFATLRKAERFVFISGFVDWFNYGLFGIFINGHYTKYADYTKYAEGGEFGHTSNGAGKFEEGGYMAKGEDYEYYNKFGLEQSDFEKIVEVWHMHEKTPTVEVEKQYNMVLDAMEDKYGEAKIDDVVDDIYHRHGLMKIMNYAEGGKTNNGDNLPNTVEEYFAAMNNFSMRLGEAEANFANDNGTSYQRVLAERDEFFEKTKAKWYAELHEGEGNFAKDGGKSYEAALKKLEDARLRFAKGGEITPKVNSQIVERAEIIYADNNGSTKEDFDMAYHQAIREAGYNVEEFILTMKNIGADYGHEGDDYYAKGGKVEDAYMLLYNFVDEKMIEGDEEAETMINEKGYSLTYDELYDFVDEKMIEGDSEAENILNKANRYAKGGKVTSKNHKGIDEDSIVYSEDNTDDDAGWQEYIFKESGKRVPPNTAIGYEDSEGNFILFDDILYSDKSDEHDYYAKGGKVKGRLSDTHKYVPNRMIQEIEVERKGKTTFIDGADILDGVYVKKGVKYAHGGSMPHVHSKKHKNG